MESTFTIFISFEAFLFGAIHILTLNDYDVPQEDTTSRLAMLTYVLKVAIARGCSVDRQLQQGIEMGAVSWQSSLENLVQLTPHGTAEHASDTHDNHRMARSDLPEYQPLSHGLILIDHFERLTLTCI